MPVYLDENGNEIPNTPKVYLDDNGEPIGGADTPAEPGRSWGDTARDALPMAGGAIGGYYGGVIGAAAGGMAGEGYRQLATHAKELPGAVVDVARNLWEQPRATLSGFREGAQEGARGAALTGAVQGGLEGAGGIAGRLLTRGASRLYQSALKPSVALRRAHPNVVETGLREGIPVSAKGTERAATLRTASRQQADDLIAAAEQAGAPRVPTNQAVSGFGAVQKDAAQRAALGMADDTADVTSRAAALHRNNPGGFLLTKAQAMKRTAQDAADSAFRTQERGGVIRGVDAQLDKATAQGLRRGIEQAVPGVAAVNQRTQSLAGLAEGLAAAEGRLGNNLPQAVGARGALGALAGGGTYAATGDPTLGAAVAGGSMLLSNPNSASQIARLMNRTGQGAQSKMTPLAIRAAILALMASGNE